ncbi:MAG TPA: hypothetical protein VGC11_14410 [Acidimicrobiia bacterium]|jgi:hypothetical protein
MGLAASAKVLGAAAVWRLTGVSAAGRTLVDAAASGDESAGALAGVLLVRSGDRAVDLVATALASGDVDPALVDVLTSIGTPAARHSLESLSSSSDPQTAAAAAAALRQLDEIAKYEQ